MKAQANPADTLRSVPPRDFIRARDALAAQLTKRGRVAEARQVARLRRPGPVVWALNRAALARPRELAALVETVDRLRRAQLGEGDVRAAMEGYRAAFEPLVRGAHQVLREAGTAVTAALDRRMRSTLLAAVTERGLRAELGAGRLDREHADPGFAVLSRGPVPAGLLAARPSARSVKTTRPAPPPPPKSPPRSESAAAAAAKTRRAAREQARAARRAAREARSQARRAERAERAAQAAERRVAAMRRALAAIEEQSAKLRARADEARGRVTGAAESPRPAQPRVAPPEAAHSGEPRSRPARS
jgi:hypothetical protein